MSKSILLQNPSSREEFRERIRQTVEDAQKAAQQAAEEAAKDAGREQRVERIVIPNVPGVPGTPQVIVNPRPFDNTIPPQVESISIAFFIAVAAVIIGLPIMRAIARRIERGTPIAAPIPAEVREQLQHLNQSVDAIAIEVERISEGQRFATKLLTERNRDVTTLAAAENVEPR
jgi:hypothetical protein